MVGEVTLSIFFNLLNIETKSSFLHTQTQSWRGGLSGQKKPLPQ